MSKISQSLATLAALVNEALAEEGITPELLEMVMLDITHTPVIAVRGERLEQAVEAIPTMGGNYLVRHPLCPQPVSAESVNYVRPKGQSFRLFGR